MKFSAFLALLAVASTQAFAPSNMPKARSNTQLYSRTDSSDLIQQALAASKKYGASSPEARLAWEAVEEVDSADNRWDIFVCMSIEKATWWRLEMRSKSSLAVTTMRMMNA